MNYIVLYIGDREVIENRSRVDEMRKCVKK